MPFLLNAKEEFKTQEFQARDKKQRREFLKSEKVDHKIKKPCYNTKAVTRWIWDDCYSS